MLWLRSIPDTTYHALLCFGVSVIGAVAVGGIAVYALRNYSGTLERNALLGTGLAVAGVNEASKVHPFTVNELIWEGILGNWKKWNKARDEWYELKQKLADLQGGGAVLCGGGEAFLHVELQQLSRLVENVQGHLVHVIADWKLVRNELQATADQIRDATGQDQVAVILRNVKAAAGRWEAAMKWANACLPSYRPDAQKY